MRKLILIVQTSFDGYVAGPNGEFDHFIGGEENLGFVCSLIQEGDAILLGRKSYELLNTDWLTAANKPGASKNIINYSNWYNSVRKYVLSKTLPITNSAKPTVISENILSAITKLKGQAGKNIFIFGSPTAVHTLLELNLIDNIYLILHPVIFGDGICLFKETKSITKLALLSTTQLSSGTLGLEYAINKESRD